MPFIGGWIGYVYAPEKVVVVEKVVIQEATDSYEQDDEIQQPSPQTLLDEYKIATGGLTYTVSSTSIRTLAFDAPHYSAEDFDDNFQEFTDLNIEEDVINLTELPYLTVVASTSQKFVLTADCFRATECGNSGLYLLDLLNNSLSEMKISNFYDEVWFGSQLSPDKSNVVTVIDFFGYDGTFISSNLSVLDIFNDTYTVLDSISERESQSFCPLGMGCNLPIKWLSSKKFEVEIQNLSDSSFETKVYQF
jgi:hypothetical protein